MLETAPRDVDALLIRGQARASAGQLLEAQTDLERARKVARLP